MRGKRVDKEEAKKVGQGIEGGSTSKNYIHGVRLSRSDESRHLEEEGKVQSRVTKERGRQWKIFSAYCGILISCTV